MDADRTHDTMVRRVGGPLLAIAMGLLVSPMVGGEHEATPPSSIAVPDGFRVELLRSAREGEDSWISMSFDPQGRIVLGLDTSGVARLTPPAGEPESTWRFERLDDTLRHCRGVLWAHGAIYVSATDRRQLWRLRDADGDGRFEDRACLREFEYEGPYGHGPNQLAIGPDGAIHLVLGDHVTIPADAAASSPYRGARSDRLFVDQARQERPCRVGYVARIDPAGREFTVIAGGFRNPVDVAFDAEGEMFTWDADMEWNVGLPWYRPTRVNHVVSGGDYGWRWTPAWAVWPSSYQDSLPTSLDTGLGSPTAVVFGTRGRFPERYRLLLYMADWQHGRILAATPVPDGAGYQVVDELFASGAPLNVCDMEFGADGGLYFISGGRGSQSGLYRISHVGPEPAAPAPIVSPEAEQSGAESRDLRRQLEAFHTAVSPEAVPTLWPHLGASDRWLRNAARVGLERQPANLWTPAIAGEPDELRWATAMLAWMRVADDAERADAWEAWVARTPPEGEVAVLTWLRAASLGLARGSAPAAILPRITARLEAVAAEESADVRRMLAELLVAVRAPAAIPQGLDWLEESASQEDQLLHAFALSWHPGPWSVEQRRRLLAWLRASQEFRGGRLLARDRKALEDRVVAGFTPDERAALAVELAALEAGVASQGAATDEPQRAFVRKWTVDELEPHLPTVAGRKPAKSPRSLLVAGRCLRCHQFGGEGANIGPDLTAVGGRFDLRSVVESIVEPSRVVDEKYRTTVWQLADGRSVSGRAMHVAGDRIEVETDPLSGAKESVNRAEIEAAHANPVSPMPAGLVDTFTLDEILDLLATLRHGGRNDGWRDPDQPASLPPATPLMERPSTQPPWLR